MHFHLISWLLGVNCVCVCVYVCMCRIINAGVTFASWNQPLVNAIWLTKSTTISGRGTDRTCNCRRGRNMDTEVPAITYCTVGGFAVHGALITRVTRSSSATAEIAQGAVITPFNVIQGHRFWYQSTAHTRLPISD